MSRFKFEGAIDDISPRQLEFIGSVLEDRGYKSGNVKVEPVGKVGDNYVANVKRIVIENDGDTFKMVGKFAPSSEAVRTMGNTVILFNNEYIMYTEVLPKFAEMQKQADVSPADRLRFATCYGTLMEPPNELILLEDLDVSDYVMLDRFKSLTDAEVKLVLKNFAILHSLSYALKKQDPEKFDDFKNRLINMWALINQSPEIEMYFGQMEKDILDMLDNDSYKKVCTGILMKMTQNSARINKIDLNSKYVIIQQGDSWTNNIMFRLQDETAVECCMIDYQISKAASPVADIHYMIFNCTDYETRSKHYHDWIDYYHSELDRCLHDYGLKANLVYPRDQLDADLRTNGKLSLGLSFMLASVLIRETADAQKMKNAMGAENGSMEEMLEVTRLTSLEEGTIVRFKKRVEGLILSFMELGYV